MNSPKLSHRLCLLTASLFAFAALDASADEKPATLKDAYKDQFKIGTAISRAITSGRGFRRTPEQVAADIALVKAQFNQVVPENEMKWGSLHPRAGKDGYDFAAADAFVEFGEANNMELVGHTLVWHSQTPAWVFEGTHLPPGATATPPADKPAAETTPAAKEGAAPPPPVDGAPPASPNAPGIGGPGRGPGGGGGPGFGGGRGFNLDGPRASREELLERMREHIHTVVGRSKSGTW